MEWWEIVAVFGLGLFLVTLAALFALKRSASERVKKLAHRVQRLPLRAKLRLARDLMLDAEVPLLVRFIPPAVVLYLAMPVDLIPDFIPVFGQLDDIIVLAIGAALLVRFTPVQVLEGHVANLEATVESHR